MTKKQKAQRLARIKQVNDMLEIIARHGGRFFYDPRYGQNSRMGVDDHWRLWWFDSSSQKRVYLQTPAYSPWRGFTNGGTMRRLIQHAKRYIMTGEPIPVGHFGPWPQELCDGDLWGYGDAMATVRDEIKKLGITT